MKLKKTILLTLIMLIIFTMGSVSANDENITDCLTVNGESDIQYSVEEDSDLEIADLKDNKLGDSSAGDFNESFSKRTIVVYAVALKT